MSAEMVGEAVVDAMLTAGLVVPGRNGPLRWVYPAIDRGDVEGVDEYLRLRDERRRELTRDTAQRVGDMLVAENALSVAARYRRPPTPSTYRFELLDGPIGSRAMVVVLRLIGHYEYHACEHPGWDRSGARAFCEALRREVIEHLPGYVTAPTSQTRHDVFVRATRGEFA